MTYCVSNLGVVARRIQSQIGDCGDNQALFLSWGSRPVRTRMDGATSSKDGKVKCVYPLKAADKRLKVFVIK
jgi:hypothetical protein